VDGIKMKMTRKLSLAVLSVSAVLLSGQAFAMNNSASSSNAAAQAAPQASPVQHASTLHAATHIKTTTPKPKMRIVREPIPTYSQATRTDTQGRFVIATDTSKDTMKVYKTVKHSKSMPNLFKN
jgi:hypothetical protein